MNTKYHLVDMPFNLMVAGDVFQGSDERWFLVVRIDRKAPSMTVCWVDKIEPEVFAVTPEDRFNVLLPESYDMVARSFGAKF